MRGFTRCATWAPSVALKRAIDEGRVPVPGLPSGAIITITVARRFRSPRTARADRRALPIGRRAHASRWPILPTEVAAPVSSCCWAPRRSSDRWRGVARRTAPRRATFTEAELTAAVEAAGNGAPIRGARLPRAGDPAAIGAGVKSRARSLWTTIGTAHRREGRVLSFQPFVDDGLCADAASSMARLPDLRRTDPAMAGQETAQTGLGTDILFSGPMPAAGALLVLMQKWVTPAKCWSWPQYECALLQLPDCGTRTRGAGRGRRGALADTAAG